MKYTYSWYSHTAIVQSYSYISTQSHTLYRFRTGFNCVIICHAENSQLCPLQCTTATQKMNQVTGTEGQTTISNRNSASYAASRTQADPIHSIQSLYNDEVKQSFTLINIFHRRYGWRDSRHWQWPLTEQQTRKKNQNRNYTAAWESRHRSASLTLM